MKHIIIDTNAFLRFFLNDIPAQKIIVENLLRRAKNSEIVINVPQIVIFELHFVLDKYYEYEKNDIIDRLKVLVSSDYLDIESREIFIPALNFYKNMTISFVDSFLYCKSQIEQAELFTFDQKLQKLK